MLCHVCQSIFRGRNIQGPHHTIFQDLELAANNYCQICAVIYKQYRNSGVILTADNHVRQPFLQYEFTKNPIPEEPDIHSVYISSHVECFLDYEAFIVPSLPGQNLVTQNPQVPRDDLPDEETSCEQRDLIGPFAVNRTALGWLKTCEEKHGHCHNQSNNQWYPKRLLDLNNGQPRLIITENEKPRGSYAALSHCWGKNKFFTLSTDNLERVQDEIKCDELPLTFRNAIDITRGLKMSYLWIDSICILQSGEGSDEDWKEHATSMTSVYRYCAVNISADRASAPVEGCYMERDPCLVAQQCQISWHGFSDRDISYNILCWDTDGVGALQALPLAKRAWVVQERLLAPRVLHFGLDRLFWECNEIELASEAIPFGIPSPIMQYYNYGGRARMLSAPKERPVAANGHTTEPPGDNECWRLILREYTSCDLRYSFKDKFKALTGIAQRMSEMRNDKYIGGFFRADILWDILWYVNCKHHSTTRRAPGDQRAPTWSWACMDGKIDYHDGWSKGVELVARVVNVLDHDGKPSGDVRSGSIILEGDSIPAICQKCERSPSQLYTPSSPSSGHWTSYGKSKFGNPSRVWIDDLSLFGQNDYITVVAIPIIRMHGSGSEWNIKGLILCEKLGTNIYNKVGIFELHMESDIDIQSWRKNINIEIQ